MSDSKLAFRLWCPPGVIADLDLLHQMFAAFMGNNDLMEYQRSRMSGPDNSAEQWDNDRAAWMVDALAYNSWIHPLDLATGGNGVGRTFVAFRFSLLPSIDSYIRGRVEVDRVEPLLAAMAEVCDLLGCASGSVGPEQRFEVRQREHAKAKQAARDDGRFVPLDAGDGLSGVPWRLLLGRPTVELIGEDRLKSLPEETTQEIRPGIWAVAGAGQPDDWVSGPPIAASEATAVEHLGAEFFFDPASGRLPEQAAAHDRGHPALFLTGNNKHVISQPNGNTESAAGHPLLRYYEKRQAK